jgi:LysM repeat protein
MPKSEISDLKTLRIIKTASINLLKQEPLKFGIGFSTIILLILSLSIIFVNEFSSEIISSLSSFNQKTKEYMNLISTGQKDNGLTSILNADDKVATNSAQPEVLTIESGQISSVASDKVSHTKDSYIVQKGDTLFIIAQKAYGDKEAWMKIATQNNIKNPDLIEVGQTLKIPR